MIETFLNKIVTKTRERVERTRSLGYAAAIERRARRVRASKEANRFRVALSHSGRTNIIAEIKRASPSKGVINADIDVAKVAGNYAAGGAAAISVLTESEYFSGEIADLVLAAKTVDIPVLRKDFMVDSYQIYEAAAAGADAILLIVAALSETELREFSAIADGLGLDSLVEIHTADELETARKIDAKIIGVNNRNLQTLEVSLDVSRELIGLRPEGVLMISESGLSTKDEIDELKELGFNGFLIGETLMRTGNASETLGAWV
ncbi:MAG TPA: indole-3-glycerol phosphate synthase TrpC [Pyrinomonadaceae bacterium]|nr:indole-3-glycerol phosphate synthase TrpC [Acidobacteriota bacterium]HQZ97769.1 indole-3-glycerol phosphate synthase TrpC [Pyrinomonadaceae bacterium]